MNEHAIAWFAIPAIDRDRARAFYSAVLDIEMPDLPTPMGTCSVFPQMETGVSGSLNDFMGVKPSADAGVTIWLTCGDDLQVALDKVEGAGGQILSGKESIENHGYIAMILDTEGNRIGLHSPS